MQPPHRKAPDDQDVKLKMMLEAEFIEEPLYWMT